MQVEEQGRVLRWGDYEGNFMFNTLGELGAAPAIQSTGEAWKAWAALFGTQSVRRHHVAADENCFLKGLKGTAMTPMSTQPGHSCFLSTYPSPANPSYHPPPGNLLVHPACALLFLDFSSSDVLMAAGDAEVLHKDRELPGAHVSCFDTQLLGVFACVRRRVKSRRCCTRAGSCPLLL